MNIATQAIEKANVPATQAEIGSYAAACPDRKAFVRYPVMGINTKPLKKRIQMIISIIVPYVGDINSPLFLYTASLKNFRWMKRPAVHNMAARTLARFNQIHR
ncbi:MAG: hypothetical protein ABRQ23_11880 [Syntrophomonadaceae bacterium]